MRQVIRRQRTVIGRLAREIDRKSKVLSAKGRTSLQDALCKAWQIAGQSQHRKMRDGKAKLANGSVP